MYYYDQAGTRTPAKRGQKPVPQTPTSLAAAQEKLKQQQVGRPSAREASRPSRSCVGPGGRRLRRHVDATYSAVRAWGARPSAALAAAMWWCPALSPPACAALVQKSKAAEEEPYMYLPPGSSMREPGYHSMSDPGTGGRVSTAPPGAGLAGGPPGAARMCHWPAVRMRGGREFQQPGPPWACCCTPPASHGASVAWVLAVC